MNFKIIILAFIAKLQGTFHKNFVLTEIQEKSNPARTYFLRWNDKEIRDKILKAGNIFAYRFSTKKKTIIVLTDTNLRLIGFRITK